MSCRHITRLAGSGRRCKFGLWAGVVGMALWSADAAVGQLPPTGLATGARTTAIDQPLEAVRPVYTPATNPEAWAVRQRLEDIITVDFDNQPLTEVAQILSDDTQIQIWLDKKALNEAAIPTDKSITVHLRGRVRTILDLICQEQDLDYYIRDNILILTTPEEAERKMDTRIYPVQEVLDRLTGLYQPLSGSTWGCPAVMPGTAPRPGASSPVPANNDQSQAIEPTGSISVSFDGQVQVPSGSVPRQAGEVPIFQPAETGRQSAVNPLPGGDPRATSPQGACPTCCFPPAVMPASAREAAVQALIDTLTASVEPDSWDINGGNASIMELGGVLVVSQTERGHREFAEVLASLRSATERNADHKEQLP